MGGGDKNAADVTLTAVELRYPTPDSLNGSQTVRLDASTSTQNGLQKSGTGTLNINTSQQSNIWTPKSRSTPQRLRQIPANTVIEITDTSDEETLPSLPIGRAKTRPSVSRAPLVPHSSSSSIDAEPQLTANRIESLPNFEEVNELASDTEDAREATPRSAPPQDEDEAWLDAIMSGKRKARPRARRSSYKAVRRSPTTSYSGGEAAIEMPLDVFMPSLASDQSPQTVTAPSAAPQRDGIPARTVIVGSSTAISRQSLSDRDRAILATFAEASPALSTARARPVTSTQASQVPAQDAVKQSMEVDRSPAKRWRRSRSGSTVINTSPVALRSPKHRRLTQMSSLTGSSLIIAPETDSTYHTSPEPDMPAQSPVAGSVRAPLDLRSLKRKPPAKAPAFPVGSRPRGAVVWGGPERSDELDYSLYDAVNGSQARLAHDTKIQRLIFESSINEVIAREEPYAPRVGVIDRYNGPPPQLDFVYTNRLLYRRKVGAAIPASHCGCIGGCTPTSQCQCLATQEWWSRNKVKGFAYDQHGRLRLPKNIPIKECNSRCGCPADCHNRRAGNGRRVAMDLVKTLHKGWGVCARDLIRKGEFLCVYSGELLSYVDSENRGKMIDDDVIPLEDRRSYLFDIDPRYLLKMAGYKLLLEDGLLEIAPSTFRQQQRDGSKESDAESDDSDWARDFREVQGYAVDALHYGNIARFFNHSCMPNAALREIFVDDEDPMKVMLGIFARREIKAGEEICISYRGLLPGDLTADFGDNAVENMQLKVRRGGANQAAHKQKPLAAAAIEGTASIMDVRCHCGSANCDGIMFNVEEDEAD